MSNHTVARFVAENYGRRINTNATHLPPMYSAEHDKRRVVVPECMVGIEIEAEHFGGWNDATAMYSKWFTKAPEPSLRNHGVELKTPPIRGQDIVGYLNALDIINKELGLRYNDLTGLHVHVDMQKSSLYQVANLLMVYLVFERALFKFSGNRMSSIYCNPLQYCDSSVQDMLKLDMSYGIDNGKKYMACNYLPLRVFGTIEFRHAVGTNDTTFMLNWINLLGRLWKFAHTYEYVMIRDRICGISTTEELNALALDVFQEEIRFISDSTLWNSMADGVAFVKECFIPTEPLQIDDTVVVRRKRAAPKKNMKDMWLELAEHPVIMARGEIGGNNARVQIIDDVVAPNAVFRRA